ncbi:hypothetical protein STAS_19852 [Striga asiatica]|uniref:Uncharacterized protein n=1 Tax=Striga asiatica TaxID=4170 RepID=A0A5A7QDE0_STRAF|nr:hypothetical protein STAS_19852 [Striga asiatica]
MEIKAYMRPNTSILKSFKHAPRVAGHQIIHSSELRIQRVHRVLNLRNLKNISKCESGAVTCCTSGTKGCSSRRRATAEARLLDERKDAAARRYTAAAHDEAMAEVG